MNPTNFTKREPPFFEAESYLVDAILQLSLSRLIEGTPEELNEECYRCQIVCNELTRFINQPDADAKSAIISFKLRQEGNFFFEHNKLNEAWQAYTMSIQYAPPGSRELSLAYANRSAVLYKAKWMTDCLADIDHALSLNYPDNLKAKLYLRQANCLQALNPKDRGPINKAFNAVRQWLEKIDDKNKESMRQLLKEHETLKPAKLKRDLEKLNCYKVDFEDIPPKLKAENPIIPGLSDAVELKYSDKYGRHCVATRDIKPGEIIGVQKPYMNIIILRNRYKLCWHCGKQAWSSIPCDGCAEVIYCSTTCRDKAYVEYHDIECFVLRRIFAYGMDGDVPYQLRLTIKGLKEAGNSLDVLKKNLSKIDDITDPMKKVLTQGKVNPEKFASVYGLMSHPLPDVKEQMKSLIYSVLIAYFLVQKVNFGKKLSKDLNILMNDQLFLYLVGFVEKNNRVQICNAFQTAVPCKIEKSKPISYSVTPAFSFFNHSCIPMVFRKRHGEYLVITSVCPIKKGEQIFDTYRVNFIEHEKSFRTVRLTDFCFVCDCNACINNWPPHSSPKSPVFLPEIVNQMHKVALYERSTNIIRSRNKLFDVSDEIDSNAKLVEKLHCLMEKNSPQIMHSTILLMNIIFISSLPLFHLD